MGIEPTYPAWKAGALADVLHPHKGKKNNGQRPKNIVAHRLVFYEKSQIKHDQNPE